MEVTHFMTYAQLQDLCVVFGRMGEFGQWHIPKWLELAIRTCKI